MSTGGGGSSSSSTEGPIPLPDIRDQLKRKELQEKIAKMEEEEKEQKVKIKRSDKAAFIKVSVVVVLQRCFARDLKLHCILCHSLTFKSTPTTPQNALYFLPNCYASSWNPNPLPMPTIPFSRKKRTVP